MRASTLPPPPPAPVAIFSDVDGTLLDARGRLALSRAEVAALAPDFELVLTSSRTMLELAAIQRRLRLVAPLIAENGAVVRIPPFWRGSRKPRPQVLTLGAAAARVRARVRRCARTAGIAVVEQPEARALQRTRSVCLRDVRGDSGDRFLQCLGGLGITATRSGRWITATSGVDKGAAVRALLALAERSGAPFAASAAIGNAPNDASLLAAAQWRFAIRNPRRGHDPALLAVNAVQPLSASGARAWREFLAVVRSNRRRR